MSDQLTANATSFDDVLESASATTTANANAIHAANQPKPRSLVPGIDAFLGRGYDVFGEFASPISVRARIYDLPSEPRVDQPTLDKSLPLDPDQLAHAFIAPPEELHLVYARPEHVGYMDVFQASIDVRQLDTSDKDETSWGVGGTIEGSYGGFKGEISSRFDTASTRLATTKCLQAVFEMVYWKLDVGNYSYTNPPPIVADVKQDFATRSPDDLMAKYGTHCLEDVGIGTKIVHSYTIDTSKFSRSVDVEAALKAKYQAANWSAGMNVDAEYHDAAWNDRSAVSVRIFTYGTSDNQLAEITDMTQGLGDHPMKVLRQGWHNPTLIKFYQQTLKPLWKIENLMSAEKAAAFEARFKERAASERNSLAMLFQGLAPLYLLSTKSGSHLRYRFANTVHYKDASGEWKLENDGRPWLYASAQSKPGLVPLYELALNNNDAIVRYETESWIKMIHDYSNEEGYTWSKTGRILGYVHDNGAPNTPVPAGSEPVYAFYSGDLQASNGLFYSHLNELVWDGGWWKPAGEDWLWEVEANKIVQANLDAWWNNQDWWTRTFCVKPSAAHVAHAMGEGGVPTAFVATGIPHWFALLPG